MIRHDEALIELRRCYALDLNFANWNHPSTGWISECERSLEENKDEE